MEKMFAWDIAGRLGQTDIRGFTTEMHEFDYKKPQVVYKENGVTIHAFPAIHAVDGSVSYALDWNGMRFIFSSDTYPNKWFIEYARGADFVIHECFIAVPDLVSKFRLTPEAALQVGTQIHTAPEAFGKVMSMVEPRLAVAYHFFKDPDTTGPVLERIRTTYDGPLSLAEDHMVWLVTKDNITERMAVVYEHSWNPPMASPAVPPDPNDRVPYSPEIIAGRLDVDDVVRPIYEEASRALGREFEYPSNP
jgi:ribonuclease Z